MAILLSRPGRRREGTLAATGRPSSRSSPPLSPPEGVTGRSPTGTCGTRALRPLVRGSGAGRDRWAKASRRGGSRRRDLLCFLAASS